MIGAMADTANTEGTEQKADRQLPGSRSSESWREELDRWLNDSTSSVQDEPTEKAPILLRTPSMHGRKDDLPVFSDDEETARKETNVHDWTPHQSKDISSRIAELRKTLTLSMEKSSDLRSLKASAEKSERETTSIDSAKKDQMQTVKTTLNYGDDSLSLKPYLSKNRDDNYLEKEKGNMRIPGPEIPGKVNVMINKNKKIPKTNPSCPHEE